MQEISIPVVMNRLFICFPPTSLMLHLLSLLPRPHPQQHEKLAVVDTDGTLSVVLLGASTLESKITNQFELFLTSCKCRT